MEQYVKYLRKSRFDRDYAELSIEETLKRHEAILDKLATDRGYYIAKTYYEVVSGESIASRPQIQKMLEEVAAGLYSGVLVVDLERLARGNGADQAYISQVFQFSGTKIITPMKSYDPSNEFDEEYFEFGLFMSRREYKTINRRLIRGRESSASEGKYISSIAPYGYERVKIPNEKGFSLRPHPNEACIVQKIFEKYLMGSGTKVIANYLNDNSVPTRHGGRWDYSTISQILTNPVYIGRIRRGWSRQIKSIENGQVVKKIKRYKNPGDYKTFQGLHPALISEETFDAVQAKRLERQPSAKVKSEFELHNAFAGLIYCGICGSRIGRTTGSKSRNSIPRFRCVNGRNCHNVSADYAVVEKEIIAALRSWFDGYSVKISTQGYEDDIKDCKERIEQCKQEKAKLEAQMDNAYNLVEQGVYTLDLFKSRKEKLQGEISDINLRIAMDEKTLEKLENGEDSVSSLIPKTESLLASYDHMTVSEKNELLKAILYQIKYTKTEDGKITIDLYPKLPNIIPQK